MCFRDQVADTVSQAIAQMIAEALADCLHACLVALWMWGRGRWRARKERLRLEREGRKERLRIERVTREEREVERVWNEMEKLNRCVEVEAGAGEVEEDTKGSVFVNGETVVHEEDAGFELI